MPEIPSVNRSSEVGDVPKQSKDISELLESKKIEMIGCIYDVNSGKVKFLNGF